MHILVLGKTRISGKSHNNTMFLEYPLTPHDQIHDIVISRALSLITYQKHVLVCKIKF